MACVVYLSVDNDLSCKLVLIMTYLVNACMLLIDCTYSAVPNTASGVKRGRAGLRVVYTTNIIQLVRHYFLNEMRTFLST